MARNETVFLHLLGKTGTGKSSTGNTILGQKVFNTKSSVSAVTENIQEREGLLRNQRIIVVDGPGLVGVNTGVSEVAIKKFRQLIDAHPESRHVFLIICRYGERFTEEDEEMVKRLRVEFGQNTFENHGIVILTCGDNFEMDTEDEDLTFEQWCQQQTGAFSSLSKKCQNRVLLVNNAMRPGYQAGNFLTDLGKELNKLGNKVISHPGRSGAHRSEREVSAGCFSCIVL